MQQPDFDAMERNISLTQPSQSMSAQKQPQINQIGSSYLQGILGAGDAVRNTLASAANNLSGTNIPMAHSGSGAGYGVGNAAGNIGAFVGGGDVLDTLRMAGEGMPIIGRAAQYLGQNGMDGGLARRAIGSGIYSSLTSPNNNLRQGEIGTGASLALDSVPYVGNALSEGANYLMPQKFAQSIIQKLGGAQALNNPTQMENAAKSVLSDIKNSYQNQKQISGGMYNSVISQIPDSAGSIYGSPGAVGSPLSDTLGNVYQSYSGSSIPESAGIGAGNAANESFGGIAPNQTGNIAISPEAQAANSANPSSWSTNATPQSTFSNMNGQYPSLGSDITNNYTTPIKNMHNQFIQNPTFQNAHALQSQIGSRIRELSDNNVSPDMATANEKYALQTARDALVGRDSQGNITGDIGNYLNNVAPQAAQQYKNATDYHYQNVTPYMNNSKIAPIANGSVTNYQPSSLGNLFKAPQDSMYTIMSHLPSSTFDNVLYTKLGQTVPTKSAQGLINKYQDLDQQGLGSYISPELKSDISSLKNRINARNALQTTVGSAAGALGGSHFGPVGTVMGLGIGMGASAIANPFINYIGKRLPSTDISAAAQSGLRGTYQGLRNAILANQLNSSSNGGQ